VSAAKVSADKKMATEKTSMKKGDAGDPSIGDK
jgi:hypothetical protein